MSEAPIPTTLWGGWQRISIAIDGGPELEDSTVWWLQAPSRHADLRTPQGTSGEPMAFAGTTSWVEPSLTWTPALQLTPSDEVDTGVCTWDGEDLLEAGTFEGPDGPVTYVERWRRMPGSASPLAAWECAGGRIVRAGRWALTLLDGPDGLSAAGWELVDGAWTEVRCWPPCAAGRLPAPEADPTWTLVESVS